MKKPPVKVTVSKEIKPPKYVTFSFDRMLTKGDYSFEYFKKDTRGSSEAYRYLLDKFQKLSEITVLELMGQGKKQGFELLDVCVLAATIQNHCENNQITKDSKVAWA